MKTHQVQMNCVPNEYNYTEESETDSDYEKFLEFECYK